jgi:hypothetical protein
MRSLFRSKHKVTQEYGVNKDYYSKFGLQGHEGLDLIPTGTDWTVYALADGVVVKDEDNARSGAYGVNCTIWHPSLNRATQYCHMEFNLVENGMQVKQGQAIGKMGSTGNSTGAHVHLNLFVTDESGVRQNKDNGFLGGTNPLPFLEENVPTGEVNTSVQKNVQFDRITSFLNSISILPTDRSEDYLDNDKLVEGVKNLDAENKRKAEEITKLTEQLNQVHIEAGELKSEISDRQNAINTLNLKISDLNQAMEADAVEDHDMGVKILDLEKQLTEKDREIADLKEEKAAPIEPVIDHYEPILDEFWKNLIKGKKTKSLVDKFWGWIR